MGKKRKHRYNNKHKMTQMEFMDQICAKCRICEKGTNPEFCYNHNYRNDPVEFFRRTFQMLMQTKALMKKSGKNKLKKVPDAEYKRILESVFCPVCKIGEAGSCELEPSCLVGFQSQVKSDKSNVIDFSKYSDRGRKKSKTQKIKAQKSKSKNKNKVEPTPTFFCSDGLKDKVDSILHGDNSGEQNKAEEPTSKPEAKPGGTPEDTQP
jgi:hypothetical protein